MRRCLEEVRSSGPITYRNIALKIISDRVEDPEDPEDRKSVQAITDKLARCMRQERRKGHVRSVKGEGAAMLWEKVR